MDTTRNHRSVNRIPVISRRDIVLIHRLLTILSRGIDNNGRSVTFIRDPEVTSSYVGNKRVTAGEPITPETLTVRIDI